MQQKICQILIKMFYNLNSASQRSSINKYNNQLLTTKITSNSCDFKTQLPLIIQKVINPNIRHLKKQAFKQIKGKQKSQNDMLLFVNHCATMIQSQFRGYKQRKYYKLFKPVLYRFKQLLFAAVAGWRVRRIMKLKCIHRKCENIKGQMSKNNLRQVRIKKRDLIDEIARLENKGKWVSLLQQDRKNKQQMKRTSIVAIFRPKSYKKDENNKGTLSIQKTKKVAIQQKQKSPAKNGQQQQFLSSHNNKPFALQQQIPIKSTGFYNLSIGGQTLQTKTNQTNKSKNKLNKKRETKQKVTPRTINEQKKQSAQLKPISAIGSQKQKIIESTTKKSGNQNISTMSIHLQTEQINVLEQMPVQKRVLKIDRTSRITQIPAKLEDSKDSKLSTQKIKKTDRKGIKVTLSSNVTPSQGQSKIIDIEEVEQIPQTKDELKQILEVYNGVYSNKKIEINQKLNEMKTHRKFVS